MPLDYYSEGPAGPAGATGPAGPTGPGVPVGGTAGQVLAKVDSDNYDTQWVTPSAGGGGFYALGPITPGRYYTIQPRIDVSTATLSVPTTQYQALVIPFAVASETKIDRIGLQSSTGGTTVFRVGIYAQDVFPGTGLGALVSECGTLAIPGNGVGYEITLSPAVTLSAGKYWVVLRQEISGGTGTVRAETTRTTNSWYGNSSIAAVTGASSVASLATTSAFGTAGSLPASGSGTALSGFSSVNAIVGVRGSA